MILDQDKHIGENVRVKTKNNNVYVGKCISIEYDIDEDDVYISIYVVGIILYTLYEREIDTIEILDEPII